MILTKGTILRIAGHPMSGLCQLQLDSEIVHIESGYGVRHLASCFGATEGSGDLMEKIEGQVIWYSTDFMGVLESFIPDDQIDLVVAETPGARLIEGDLLEPDRVEIPDQA